MSDINSDYPYGGFDNTSNNEIPEDKSEKDKQKVDSIGNNEIPEDKSEKDSTDDLEDQRGNKGVVETPKQDRNSIPVYSQSKESKSESVGSVLFGLVGFIFNTIWTILSSPAYIAANMLGGKRNMSRKNKRKSTKKSNNKTIRKHNKKQGKKPNRKINKKTNKKTIRKTSKRKMRRTRKK